MTNQKMMMRPSEAVTYNPRDLSSLRKLVAKGESLHLEFKRKVKFPEKIVREIIAFANTDGGTLLIGVNDDGTLPGVKFPEEESHNLRDALVRHCQPQIEIEESIISLSEKRFVLQLQIPKGVRKPYHFVHANQKKEIFIRIADNTVKASPLMGEIIRRSENKNGVRFYFGNHEKQLMQFLETNPTVTLKEFITFSGLNRFQASKKLVLLTLAKVIKVTPTEKGDLFSRIY